MIVGIPGGPGLSSATLRGIEHLGNKFDLALIDPPGCGESDELPVVSRQAVVAIINKLVSPLSRQIIVVAHSFGGTFAADLALFGELDLNALVFIGSPLTAPAVGSLQRQYASKMNPDLQKAANEFENSPSRETFNLWFSKYGSLFFTPKFERTGAELLKSDLSSPLMFMNVRPHVLLEENQLLALTQLDVPKLFLVGEFDELFPTLDNQRQANELAGTHLVVPAAGHFVFFEQPKSTARLIVDFLNSAER